jgi:PhnB protein
MSASTSHLRNGYGTVRTYFYGPLDLMSFITQVFDAEEIERGDTGGGYHVEYKIGDSVLILEAMEPGTTLETATRGSVYIYVPDVDATYQRALQAGATSLGVPEDKPYGDRGAGVRDSYGNVWWIGTHLGKK